MPAETYVNDSGTDRKLQGIAVNDSGTWRDIQEEYVNDGGTWRSVFQADGVAISDQNISNTVGSGTATAGYALWNTGEVHQEIGVADTVIEFWKTPQSGMSNYECMATVNSGAVTSGTTGSWLQLNLNRVWRCQKNSVGTATANLTIQIRRSSDGVVLDSATVVLTATRT